MKKTNLAKPRSFERNKSSYRSYIAKMLVKNGLFVEISNLNNVKSKNLKKF